MAKKGNLFVCQGTSAYDKNMDSRGTMIEERYYASLKKGTMIHGVDTCCVIEQHNRILHNGRLTKPIWVDYIEKLAPGIKGSFFGLGGYKDVMITGINTKSIKDLVKYSAKSSNGVTCAFSDNVTYYIQSIDLPKFRKWMREWGHQFGLKAKGSVWMTKAEWQSFVTKAVLPTCITKSTKTMEAPTSAGGTFIMTWKNARVLYDEVEKMLKNYFANNVGITISVSLG